MIPNNHADELSQHLSKLIFLRKKPYNILKHDHIVNTQDNVSCVIMYSNLCNIFWIIYQVIIFFLKTESQKHLCILRV